VNNAPVRCERRTHRFIFVINFNISHVIFLTCFSQCAILFETHHKEVKFAQCKCKHPHLNFAEAITKVNFRCFAQLKCTGVFGLSIHIGAYVYDEVHRQVIKVI
jgi:hypothetical protein